ARDVGNQVLVAAAVESFAVLAANQKQGERALRLAAGAARLRETIGAPVAPSAKLFLERALEPVRQASGVGQAAARWADGQAMSNEQLVGYALTVTSPLPQQHAIQGRRTREHVPDGRCASDVKSGACATLCLSYSDGQAVRCVSLVRRD